MQKVSLKAQVSSCYAWFRTNLSNYYTAEYIRQWTKSLVVTCHPCYTKNSTSSLECVCVIAGVGQLWLNVQVPTCWPVQLLFLSRDLKFDLFNSNTFLCASVSLLVFYFLCSFQKSGISMSYSVDELLKTPFERRSLEEKLKIKLSGRPTPDPWIFSKMPRSLKPHFINVILIDRFMKKCPCGCEVRNSLFCFPCLLFSGETSWSKTGVRDLGHMKEYIRRHSKNKKHMSNVLNLTDIGKINIATQLDSAYRLSIQKHNEQVEKKSLHFI